MADAEELDNLEQRLQENPDQDANLGELLDVVSDPIAVIRVGGSVLQCAVANEPASTTFGLRAERDGIQLEESLLSAIGESIAGDCRRTVTAEALTQVVRWFGPVPYQFTLTPIFGPEGICTHIVLVAHRISGPDAERMDGGWKKAFEAIIGRLPDTVGESTERLTPREKQVLGVIGQGGLSDREIAEDLVISPATARTHVRNILSKTDLHDRRDLLAVAWTLDGQATQN